MDVQQDLEDIRQELAATQYWLRALIVASAGRVRLDSDLIRRTIKGLKNFAPEGRLDAADYDALAVKRLPHIEHMGNDIADTLDADAGVK